MPAESEKQRKYVFHLRGKYGTKEKTPAKFKWVWESGWEHVKGEKVIRSPIRTLFEKNMF